MQLSPLEGVSITPNQTRGECFCLILPDVALAHLSQSLNSFRGGGIGFQIGDYYKGLGFRVGVANRDARSLDRGSCSVQS